ncbi:MAG: ABC transporter substrate-binding protein, partial [Chloroflexota bacterium]|nr:ABC transporter substrate-binding protein [Chloroflexota bacterium]
MFRVSWLSVLLATAITIAIVQPARATTHHDTVPPTGTITMSDWQRFPDGCNPINPYNASDEELCASVWDNLFRLDSTLHYQADLSDGVPSTHSGDVQIVDGTTIVTYTLKPQLSWSDGSPLTMDDVVFSYDLNAALGNIEGIASILSMTETSSLTLVVTYAGLDAAYLSNGTPVIVPKTYLERKYGTSDIQTIASRFLSDRYTSPVDVVSGPYVISAWNANQDVTLTPNTYYTALMPDPFHPRAAQIQFVSGGNGDTGLVSSSVYNHSRNVAEDFAPRDIPTLRQISGYNTIIEPTTTMEHLEFNLDGALGDQRVRHALEEAIDKVALF